MAHSKDGNHWRLHRRRANAEPDWVIPARNLAQGCGGFRYQCVLLQSPIPGLLATAGQTDSNWRNRYRRVLLHRLDPHIAVDHAENGSSSIWNLYVRRAFGWNIPASPHLQ